MPKRLDKPTFCFTGDVDWAPEAAIESALDFFHGESIPYTPFITHESEAIKHAYRNDGQHVGIHPNFSRNTTQGETVDEVISYAMKLWDGAEFFRSHNYTDSLYITQKFSKCGMKYDSNALHFLQPNIQPHHLITGIDRYPVFFEDMVYLDVMGASISGMVDMLSTGGLKIFNSHPIHIYLNTPDVNYYARNKDAIYSQKKLTEMANPEHGLRSLLEDLVDFIHNNKFEALYFRDLCNRHKTNIKNKELSDYFILPITEKPVINTSVWTSTNLLGDYSKSTSEQKADILKNVYDGIDGTNIYATSPDFNLRELEIDFIMGVIRGQMEDSIKPTKILDIGCGNGYTDIRVAQKFPVEITGMDFSEAMIEGANKLKSRLGKTVGYIDFKVGDARTLPYKDRHFNIVISERLVMNLPDEETQKSVIMEVHRVLKKGGLFIMVEGTRNGLRRLNDFRGKVGLGAILDKSDTNVSSLKFEEEEIEAFLSKHFEIVKKQHFGMYYLISRVVHPLLVAPNQPRYDAKINEIARKIAGHEPDYKQMSHILGYVLRRSN